MSHTGGCVRGSSISARMSLQLDLFQHIFSMSEQRTLQSLIRALLLFLNLKCSNCTQELSHHEIAFFHLSAGLLIGRKSRPNIMIPRKDVSHDRFPSGDLSL